MPALGLFGGASARALGWGIFSAVASGGGPTPTPTGVINVDLSTITGVGFFDLPTSFPTLMLGMTFRPDGTRMYASDFGGSNLIYQYNISTPWNLSTLSFSGTFNPSRGSISDIAFNGTGTHLYVIDRSGENCIMQYFCSTPWDITTASFIANSNLTLENIDCLFVSADGLNFIVGSQTTSFQRWSSSSPNVITSLSRTVGFSHGLSVLGMGMDPAGTFIYYPEFNASGNFYKRQLSTPWDVSTAGTATSRALPSSGSAFGNLDQVYIADDPKRIFIADYQSGGRRIHVFSYTSIGGGGGSPPPPPPSISLTDYTNITSAGATAFSYINMPGGSRTLLNYLQSFGVNGSSSNDASSQWNNSFSGNISYAASPITNNSYFTQFNRVRVIDGDGSQDGPDWAVFNFGTTNGSGDFDGTSDSNAHFGGESSASGGTGGMGRTTGQVWGYNSSTGWILLYQLPLGSGSGSAFNHSAGNWFSSGGAVTSGNGKRAAFDSTSITHLGFVVL